MSKLQRWLFEPVDVSSLVWFRMGFGAILLWEVLRYFHYGWIVSHWMRPEFHFTYDGFHWVQPWSGNGLILHFFALGVLAVFIVIGFCYRISMLLFFLGFTYLFLLDKSYYLNHFYLVSLLSFLLIFVPAHRSFSVDAALFPKRRCDTVPRWCVALIAFQVSVPYFFGGIAKLTPDWFAGEPMRMWLAQETDFPIIGKYFTHDWMVYAFCYGGVAFDLLIVPMLMWRRTRWLAVFLLLAFHMTNDQIFQIGIFPWFMLVATGLFFPPHWFRRVFNRLSPVQWEFSGACPTPSPGRMRIVEVLLAAWVLVQIVLPLRHFFIPGNVHWTEEGHRFAWHMKLRAKSGTARFLVTDLDSGKSWTVDPAKHLNSRQRGKMATHPDMILQFAHELARRTREGGHERVSVRALAAVELNGREKRPFIDPDVDLAAIKECSMPASWIMPFEEGPLGEGSAVDPTDDD